MFQKTFFNTTIYKQKIIINVPESYEPKINNRFVVEFPEKFNIPSFAIQKCNKPKFTDNKWSDIKITFINIIKDSPSKGLFNIIENRRKMMSSDNSLFNINIKSLTATGEVVETWVIHVKEILKIDFGDLNYGDDGIQMPFIVVKPLDCVLI